MGPLNAASSATEEMDWQSSGLRRGDPVSVNDGVIHVGHLLCLDTSHALCWQPPPAAGGLDKTDTERRFKRISIACSANWSRKKDWCGSFLVRYGEILSRNLIWLQYPIPGFNNGSSNSCAVKAR